MNEQLTKNETVPEEALVVAPFELQQGDTVEEVEFEQLPEKVAEHFEKKRTWAVDPDEASAYEHIYKVTSANGNVTFLAEVVKTYSETYQERVAYIVNVDQEDITGYIEVANPTICVLERAIGRPFVGYIRTHDAFRRKGLGRAKLFQANAYTLATYGKPLHSDTLMRPEIESIWKRLVEEGKAVRIEEPGGLHQYRFYTPGEQGVTRLTTDEDTI